MNLSPCTACEKLAPRERIENFEGFDMGNLFRRLWEKCISQCCDLTVKRALGAWDSGLARVDADGHAKSAGGRFEDGFGNMMTV